MLLALRHDSILWKGPSLAAVEREAGIGRFSSRQFHFLKIPSSFGLFPCCCCSCPDPLPDVLFQPLPSLDLSA